jgi:hypothetical protein
MNSIMPYFLFEAIFFTYFANITINYPLRETIYPEFSIQFDSKIERIIFNHKEQIVGFVCRDEGKLEQSFRPYSFQGGKLEELSPACLELPLWSEVKYISMKKILLSQNQGPQSPFSARLSWLDLATGKVLDQISDADLVHVGGNYMEVKVKIGEDFQTKILDLQKERFVEIEQGFVKDEIKIQVPHVGFFSDQNPTFLSLSLFLQSEFDHTPVLGFEYWEDESNMILSYFCSKEKEESATLDNYLLWMSHAGEILLHQRINDELKGKIFGTFLLQDTFIWIVSHHNQLDIYELR